MTRRITRAAAATLLVVAATACSQVPEAVLVAEFCERAQALQETGDLASFATDRSQMADEYDAVIAVAPPDLVDDLTTLRNSSFADAASDDAALAKVIWAYTRFEMAYLDRCQSGR